jgi:hypothetical protein
LIDFFSSLVYFGLAALILKGVGMIWWILILKNLTTLSKEN